MVQQPQQRLRFLAQDVWRLSQEITSRTSSVLAGQHGGHRGYVRCRTAKTSDHMISSPSNPLHANSFLHALGANFCTFLNSSHRAWPTGSLARFISTSSLHSNSSLLRSETPQDALISSASIGSDCEHFGCEKRPKYNIDGAAVGRYCKEHMQPGMVQITPPVKKCVFNNNGVRCNNRQAHLKGGASGIGYCKVHNKPGMAVPPTPVSLPPSSDPPNPPPSHAPVLQQGPISPAQSDPTSTNSPPAESTIITHPSLENSSSISTTTSTPTHATISSSTSEKPDSSSTSSSNAVEPRKPRWAAEKAAFQKELKSFSGESGVLAAQREAAAEEAWLAAEQAAKQYHLPPAVIATMNAASLLLGLDPTELASLTEGLSRLCRHIPKAQHDVWADPQQSMDELVLVLQGVPITHEQMKATILQHPSLLLSWKKDGSGPAARANELRSALGLSVAAFDDLLYAAPHVLADTPEEVEARLGYIGKFFVSAEAAATQAAALQDHVLPLLSAQPLLAAVPARALRALAVTTNSAGVPFRALATAVVADSALLTRGAAPLLLQLQRLAAAQLTVKDINLCPALLVKDFGTVVGPRWAFVRRMGTTVVVPSECKRLQDVLAEAGSAQDPAAQPGTHTAAAPSVEDVEMAQSLSDRSCWASKKVVSLSYLVEASSEELCSTLGLSLDELLGGQKEWEASFSATSQQPEGQTGVTLKEALSVKN